MFIRILIHSLFISFLASNGFAEPKQEQHRNAPGFELYDAAQQKHTAQEISGQWTILHFWASWCTPCLAELPQWAALAKKFQSKPIHWLAISEDQSWTAAEGIFPSAKLPSNILSLLDPSAKVSDLYGSYQFPETYLISPDLKIVMKWVGPQEWSQKKWIETFETLQKNSNTESTPNKSEALKKNSKL